MRLAFAGTPAAAVPSLHALLDSAEHEVVAVVTRPPARAGRGRRETRSPVTVSSVRPGPGNWVCFWRTTSARWAPMRAARIAGMSSTWAM